MQKCVCCKLRNSSPLIKRHTHILGRYENLSPALHFGCKHDFLAGFGPNFFKIKSFLKNSKNAQKAQNSHDYESTRVKTPTKSATKNHLTERTRESQRPATDTTRARVAAWSRTWARIPSSPTTCTHSRVVATWARAPPSPDSSDRRQQPRHRCRCRQLCSLA